MQNSPLVSSAADNPKSTARLAQHPIHPMLVSFPILCFVGALITDIAYWQTAEMMWADFSAWLLAAGLVMGVLAAIAGLIDFIGSPYIRKLTPAKMAPKQRRGRSPTRRSAPNSLRSIPWRSCGLGPIISLRSRDA
jgi:hypothetical protein